MLLIVQTKVVMLIYFSGSLNNNKDCIIDCIRSSESDNNSDALSTVQEDMDISSSDLEISPIKRGRKNFLTSRVLSSLDKWQISNNAAMHLISAVVEALGHDVDEYAFNTRTLQRLREDNRKKISESAKKSCKDLVITLQLFECSHHFEKN